MGSAQRIAPIFAVRDLHFGVVPGDDRHASSASRFVEDADALAAAWRSAGAEVHGPEDTEWRMHEGTVVDPDGNAIRFGSPIAKTPRS